MSRQNGASSSLMTMDKRSKIMVAVLAGVVLIAALYFLVLKKSGSNDSNATGPVAKPSAAAPVAPKASASATPKAVVTPAAVTNADSTRDPFAPLPQEAAAVSSASPAAAPSSTPTSTPTSSSSSSSTTTHSVQLLSITGDSASVSYDKGTAKTVKAGSTIATGMTVVKIDASAVFVSYNNKLYAIAPGQTVSL
jgi:hypothetical protein